MKNRKLLLIVSLVLALTMSLGGTLAYLTDTDADINVMTVGKVEIVQNEQKRTEGGLDKFVSGLPALPAVTTSDDDWAPNTPVKMDNGMWVNMWGDKVKNDIDKIVTVTNTGKSPAYVRTIVAIEDTEELDINIHISDMMAGYYETEADAEEKTNQVKTMVGDAWEAIGFVEIDDNIFYVLVATYKDPLPAGKTSAPSLTGVALDDTVTGEMIEALGDEWEIRVLSQAVQADGFTDLNDNGTAADEALEAGFPMGVTQKDKQNTIAGWMTKAKLEADIASPSEKYPDNNPPEFPITNGAELTAALAEGGEVELTQDITVDEPVVIPEGVTATLNLNGKTLDGAIQLNAGANVTIKNGTIENGNANANAIQTTTGTMLVLDNATIKSARHAVRVEGGTVTINGGSYTTAAINSSTLHALNVSNGGTVTINGGNFVGAKGTAAESGQAVMVQAGSTVTINGGTFSNGLDTTIINQGTLNINGGTISKGTYQTVKNSGSGILTINGGTFGQNPNDITGGVTVTVTGDVTANSDGTWTVSAVTE